MTPIGNPETGLALAYAPASIRPALSSLFALDFRLGELLRQTSDPMIAQLRLTWWYEALESLERAVPPAEPLLSGLAHQVIPLGIAGSALAGMVDGWEVLLQSEVMDDASLERFGKERGAALFQAAAAMVGTIADARCLSAGQAWALTDLARHMSDREMAKRALLLAGRHVDNALSVNWGSKHRFLGALAILARRDVRRGVDRLEPPGSPARVARMFWHRMTGR